VTMDRQRFIRGRDRSIPDMVYFCGGGGGDGGGGRAPVWWVRVVGLVESRSAMAHVLRPGAQHRSRTRNGSGCAGVGGDLHLVVPSLSV